MPVRKTLGNTSDDAMSTGFLPEQLEKHFRGLELVRRGVCLLNAGQFEQAAQVFETALTLGTTDRSVAALLAACLIGQGKSTEAVAKLSETIDESAPHVAPIRRALTLASTDRVAKAISTLRDALTEMPECAELHFQLGLLLVTSGNSEEAELRFEQATSLDRDHVDALVNLALCCAVRHAPLLALNHLQRAQSRKPHDPKMGLLLAQAARTARQMGQAARIRATMPEYAGRGNQVRADRKGINDLAQVIEKDPDVIEALLAVPDRSPDQTISTILAGALELLIQEHPVRAEFYLQHAQAIERLGQTDQAVIEIERAVSLDPALSRGLIELGRLYQLTNRPKDAISTLEQATHAGANFADVHYRLGNLYRDQGDVQRARSAYEQALVINNRYGVARTALEALPA